MLIAKSEYVRPHRDAAGYGFETRKQAQAALAWCRKNKPCAHGRRVWYRIAMPDGSDRHRPYGVTMYANWRGMPVEPMIRHEGAYCSDAGMRLFPMSRKPEGFVWFEHHQRLEMKLGSPAVAGRACADAA